MQTNQNKDITEEIYKAMDSFLMETEDIKGSPVIRSLENLNKDRHLFVERMEKLLTAHGQEMYERGFIDGSDITGEIANETHDIELKKMYTKGSKDKQRELTGYTEHNKQCIRTQLEECRPTKNDGYECKYNGKWYQSRPVDETPKCDCGLDDILQANGK